MCGEISSAQVNTQEAPAAGRDGCDVAICAGLRLIWRFQALELECFLLRSFGMIALPLSMESLLDHATGCQRGRLSHLEMPIWLIQRYLAARARGTYPTHDRPPAPGQR